MSEKQETPTAKPGETATPEVGNEAKTATPQTPETSQEGKVDVKTPEPATVELEKRLKQAEMRANQLENKAREDELARLKESEDYKTLAERLQGQLDEVESEKTANTERQAAIEFRDKVIAEYPEAVQKVIRAAVAKNPANFLWKDATDWEDAGEQLREQIAPIQDALGVSEDDEADTKSTRRVNANNPVPSLKGLDPDDMSFEELGKVLPRSKRDY